MLNIARFAVNFLLFPI